MIKFILLTTITLLGFLIFVGCGQQSSNTPEERVSKYLPITLHDQFILTFGWYRQLEKRYFNESDLMVVYQALSSFSKYEGAVTPPWEYDVGMWPMAQPTILQIINEMHTIEISFIPHSYWDTAFAVLQVNEMPGKWFTADLNAYLELVGLLF